MQHEPKIELIDSNTPIPGATRVVDDVYKYTDADQIGEGTYGKVYKGTDDKGQKVALKMIRMENEKEGFPITAIREIKLLSTLKHENIVNLREIVRSRVTKESKYKCDIYMVFDYAEHDLTGLMEATRHAALRPDQIKCIMDQLLRGLAYCHGNGILHRDLKASNLLINREGCLKIADFGLARNWHIEQNGKLTNRVITLWYRPPELLLGAESYGPAVDVWSVGCIFAELLTRKPLFPGGNEAAQLDLIFKLMGRPSEETWPDVTQLSFYHNIKHQAYKVETESRSFEEWHKRNQLPADAVRLLRKMLELNPAKRISAIDALFDEYFTASDVKACSKKELPKLPDCHEWTTKKRKQQQQQQQQQQHPQQQHQQQQHQQPPHGHMGYSHPGAHAPYGAGGAPGMRPQYHPGGVAGPAAAAAAAAGGAYGQRGGPMGGPDRNVRPRHSGAGGMPVGASGPVAGQAGFKPGAKPAAYGFSGPSQPGGYGGQHSYGGMGAAPAAAGMVGPPPGMGGGPPGGMGGPPQAGYHQQPHHMQRGGPRGPPQGGYPQHPQQRR